MLSAAEIDRFVRDGFVRVDGAFSAVLARRCRDVLWRKTGCDPRDRSTWTRPLVRIAHFDDPALYEAADSPRLKAAYDQLVGAGRWHFYGFGTFPIRFPVPGEPGDDGWHFDGSYELDEPGRYHVNLKSRGRALLQLFLYSDVGEDDAPTRIRVGSHLDAPPVLAAWGADDVPSHEASIALAGITEARPVALATGLAGAVWLCHPFLVHAAQKHRGQTPKFMSQPPLGLRELVDIERPDAELSPVERAVRLGLKGF